MKRSGLPYSVFGVVLLMIVAVTPGCGGGGGGGGGPVSGQTTLSGTVASGAALAGVTVTLKDSLGSSVTATTASNGSYSINTTGLVSPFLVLVTTSTGTKFYSVTANNDAATTVNVTPLSDLIVRSWYDVQGVSVDAAFAAPAANPPPSPAAVAVIGSVVQNIVKLWLNDAGVTAADFNIISTPFAANGAGFDLVLEQTTVDPAAGLVAISGGGVTQSTTVTAASGSLAVETTTTGPGGTSTSSTTTVVPVQTAQQSALDGITAALNSFAGIVNTRGAGLVAGDLLPALDAGLWGGLTGTQWAEQLAYAMAGQTVSFSGIAISSLDGTSTAAETMVHLSRSKAGQTSTSREKFIMKKISGAWYLSGDQQIANVEVRANMVRSQGSGTGTFLTVEVNIDAPRSAPTVTNLTGAAITGGPWTATALSYNGLNVAPWNSSLYFDSFGTNVIDPVISGGQPFSVEVTPAVGFPATYTQTLNAITTEPIMITNLTGGTMADATLGTAKTVNWTLPKTFPAFQIRLGTVAYTGAPNAPTTIKCDDGGEQVVIGATSTSAQITIPPQCSGQPTVAAEIYLQVYGINGELTTVYYTYQ